MVLLKRWALNMPPTRCPPVARATLIPIKALHPQSNHSPHPPTPTPIPHSFPSVSRATTMNNSDSYSSKDDVSSATWPDPVWPMGDYSYYPHPSVPQNVHLGLVSALGSSAAGSHVPDFNAANDAAFSFAPTTEMGAFANLLKQLDQVCYQGVGSSTSTYSAVP